VHLNRRGIDLERGEAVGVALVAYGGYGDLSRFETFTLRCRCNDG
jgi:hypothetical protein